MRLYRLILCVVMAGGTFPSLASADSAPDEDLAKSQAEAARTVYEGLIAAHNAGSDKYPFDLEKLNLWSLRWSRAEQALSTKKADHIAAAEAHLARMKKWEAVMQDQFKERQVSRFEVVQAKYHRIEAERWLAEVKGK